MSVKLCVFSRHSRFTLHFHGNRCEHFFGAYYRYHRHEIIIFIIHSLIIAHNSKWFGTHGRKKVADIRFPSPTLPPHPLFSHRRRSGSMNHPAFSHSHDVDRLQIAYKSIPTESPLSSAFDLTKLIDDGYVEIEASVRQSNGITDFVCLQFGLMLVCIPANKFRIRFGRRTIDEAARRANSQEFLCVCVLFSLCLLVNDIDYASIQFVKNLQTR